MKTANKYALRHCMATLLPLLLAVSGVQAAVLDTELETELEARAPNEEVTVIIKLSDKLDPRQFRVRDRHQRNPEHVKALKRKAALTQAPFRRFLEGRGGMRVRELWAINGIAVKVRADAIRELAAKPGIEKISLDTILQAPVVSLGTAALPEWNLGAVQAPDLWALGYTGTGVVVASMDTGVDSSHPDLINKWRGGNNSWFDPHGEHATPYDMNGHGTQTMGIMVGGSIGGTAIGVAPDAQWAAVKLFSDAGQATYSDIHLAFQWLLDPDGDPNTPDAPDVVNASWGFATSAGQCITEFNLDIEHLKAAAIAVVFAGGNDGPAPLTSVSPGNNVAGFSAGAVDSTNTIAGFSSRGQSACDGGVYPKTVAPGVNVNTSDLSFGGLPLYAVVSGTSYAAPHTAGAMALLSNAFPNASVAELEAALIQGALDLGVAGPDNSYGNGLVHARVAYDLLLAAGNQTPLAANDSYAMISGGVLSVAASGVLANDSDPDANPLTAVLVSPPGSGSVTLNADGSFVYTPPAAFAGLATFTYQAQDSKGARSNIATVSVSVSANQAPIAADDAPSAPHRTAAGTYPAVIINVLANDTDPDTAIDPNNRINPASVFLTTTPDKGGWTAVNADGTISYRPKAGFAGTETFRYKVRDTLGLASSPAAYVRVSVASAPVSANQAPLLLDDAASAPLRTAGIAYPAVVINVLANDSDPDTATDPNNRINPATLSLTTAPDKGGWAVANLDGTVSYRPKAGFSGTETFRYKVKDTLGLAPASGAYVRVTVQ